MRNRSSALSVLPVHIPYLAFAVALCAGLLPGCERPPLTKSGVVRVIGKTGLAPGEFHYPRAITAEPDGSIFVVDKTGRIQRFGPDGALEVSWRTPDVAAGLPVGLHIHTDGRLYIADTHYHRVLVTDRDGHLLGSFGQEGTGEGHFQLPTDVAVDRAGFIYVGEYHLTERISKWSPDYRFIGFIGDQPIAGKRLNRPAGLAIDDEQTLWVADACNHRLVRLALDGRVLGIIGEFGDRPGQLRYPYDINLTPDGNLLVCEYGNNRLQWFSKDGRPLRVWGTAGRRPGEMFGPWGATFGPDGMVYVVDSQNDRVQAIRP